MSAERSPRRGMCAAVLSLEAIALGLTTPVMITIADVPTGTALAVGLGLAAACLLLAGMLRAEWAYLAGYAVHAAARSRSILRPRRSAPAQSAAKTAPRPNMTGTTNPRPIAAAWTT